MESMLVDKYGPFMDLPEIAQLLKLETKSVYSQINRGKLDLPHIKHGKKYLFPTTEVAAFLESKIVNYPTEAL